MLSDLALSAVSHTLAFGCFTKMFPYKWDSAKYQLSLPTQWTHIWGHNFHRVFMLVLGIVTGLRFVLFMKVKDVPAQIRVLHMVWALAYVLTNICFLQFQLRRMEIMYFGNLLFEYIIKSREENRKLAEIGKERKDTVSIYVLTSTFLLFLNPPCHAVAVIHTPCSTNFVSSLYYSCEHVTENESYFFQKIPWIFAEVVMNFLFAWSFSWIMIFLGLAWIREDLRWMGQKVRDWADETVLRPAELRVLSRKYRQLQCNIILINDSFRFYLEWFQSILIWVVSLLIYGSIRLWHIEFLTYINFPVCGFRCLSESMTPLSISAVVNMESKELLEGFRRMYVEQKKRRRGSLESKCLIRFLKSCSNIKCTAGSLYTFEHSIVVITVNNCAQLTLNLLLVYK